jgi:hypothetical protein
MMCRASNSDSSATAQRQLSHEARFRRLEIGAILRTREVEMGQYSCFFRVLRGLDRLFMPAARPPRLEHVG